MMHDHLRCLAYLFQHKVHVFRAGRRLGVPLLQLVCHDLDKLWPPSLWSDYVYAFIHRSPVPARARWHHYRRTRHHWQSWVVLADDGTHSALPIPERHARELLADWEGAARVSGGTDGSRWYRQNRETIVLHWTTRQQVEEILGIKEGTK